MSESLSIALNILAYDYASSVLRKIGTEAGLMSNPIAASATIAVGAIAAVGAASIKAATSFDQSMHKIGALTDTSAAQMQWYTTQILNLAPQLDVAPTALANGLYFVISAGQSGAQAIDTLKYSAMAAAAGMTDFSGVAGAVASVMNAYRATSLDAGTATDVLTKLVTNGSTTWQSLASSIGITATTSAAAGIKVQEMAAALSNLSQVAGSHASRRIGMEFMNLERNIGIDIDGLSKRAKKLGLSFNEGAFAAAPLIDKLRMLGQITGGVGYLNMDAVKSWAAMSEAEQKSTAGQQELALATAHANSMFKNLVGGAAAFIPAAIMLSDKGTEYDHILQQMTTHGQATTQAFSVMRESTGQQLNMLHVTMDSLGVAIGLHLLPFVNKVLMALITLGRSVIPILRGGGWEQFKQTILGIGIVAGTILAPGILALLGAIAPFALALAGIVAAGILVGKAFGPISRLFHDTGVAGTAFKAILIGLGYIMYTFAAEAIADVVAGFITWATTAAGAAAATIAATWPFLLAAVAIAAVAFGIMELVQHGAQVKQFFGNLAHGAQELGGHIKDGIGGALGSAGQHIGNFFSGVGSKVHGGLAKVGDGVKAVGNAVVDGAHWLYQHNYYVQGATDFITHKIQAIRTFVPALLHVLQADIAHIWATIQRDVATAWAWIGQHITGPVSSFIGTVLGALGRFKDRILGGWLIILHDAQTAWNNFVGLITSLGTRIGTAAHDHIVQPIQDKWNALMDFFKNAGGNLIKLIINGIKGEAGNLAGAAKNALGGIAGWLGFHSPAPKVPESAQWGPNLMRMMALGIRTSAPLLGAAAQGAVTQLQRGLAGGLNASIGVTGSATPPAMGGAGAVLGLGGATNGTTTINVTFPGVTNKDEIKQALQELQQGDYRRARRAGSYQGTRAGI